MHVPRTSIFYAMKRFILILMLSLSIAAMATTSVSQAECYKPMLVEGRTWWYTQKHMLYSSEGRKWIAENGISVGEEVEIDGVKWHKINLVNSGISRKGVWEFNTEPRTIAYMREEGDKIYTIYFEDCLQCEGVSNYDGYYGACSVEQLSYQYLNVGDSYLIGYPFVETYATMDNITQVTNSGHEYTLYECTLNRGPDVSFIEGLGAIKNVLFFAPSPAYCACEDQYDWPDLRYITEGGEIIYEGIGGFKLWEANSVGNVLTEDDGTCRWYNLQGIEVGEPASPGLYIRSSRSGNEKVFIR